MLTIYKPGENPIRGLRTSLKGAQLGDGYFQAISNLRWDTGVLTVRDGISTVSGSAPGTLCLGAWSGMLNGSCYVVSAWAVSGKTALYSLDLTSGIFTELTAAAGHTGGGGSGVPTWSGSQATSSGVNAGRTRRDSATAEVVFCSHSLPRRVVAGSVQPSVDVLSISNLDDFPLIYNPSLRSSDGFVSENLKVFAHKNISLPAGATQFNYFARFSAFFQAADDKSGKTYTNSTHYTLAHTNSGAYNSGTNYCIVFAATTSVAAGETAVVSFASARSFAGEQINFVVEGSTAAVNDLFVNCALDLSTNTSFSSSTTVYDQASTDPTLSIGPTITPLDTGNNRFMVTYSIKALSTSARLLKSVRFTRRSSAPATASSAIILAICGAGAGAGFYGDTEFQIAYTDRYNGAESGGIVGTNLGGDLLKNCGGPSVVTSGSGNVAGTRIPVDPDVLYDFGLHVVNPGSVGTIYGGLNGTGDSSPSDAPNGPATSIDIYFRTPEEAAAGVRALYLITLDVYERTLTGSDHVWRMISNWCVGGTPGGTPLPILNIPTDQFGWGSSFGLTDRDQRDPGTPIPSAYNIAMPRALAVWTANQRTFAGGIRDTSGNYQYGDLYFSDLGFPFRFTSIQEDESSGSRLTFAGEKIRGGIMTSAASNGASVVYVVTDQSLNALGTAGGFVGSGYDATSLSTRVRINAHGTNEPASLAERAGVIFYIDQEGQIVRFEGGSVASISRNAVDDKTKNIPAARRGRAAATFWKDRYYLAYTPAAGAANTRILGWHDVVKEWEFDDGLPSTVAAQKVVRCFDVSGVGSGQRLLLLSGDGNVYGFEEGSAEPASAVGPSVQLRSREYQTPDLNLFRFGESQLMVDAHTATLNVDCYYKPRGSEFRSTIDCSDSESKPLAIKKDSRIRSEISVTGMPESGWSGFIDLNGNLGCGKILWRFESDAELLSRGAGER